MHRSPPATEMRSSIILFILCPAATAVAQAVSEGIAPSAAAPSGCKPNFSGNFTLNTASIANTQEKEVSEVCDLYVLQFTFSSMLTLFVQLRS